MNNNQSNYIRSVNDYSLSGHELYANLSGSRNASVVSMYIIKNLPDIETVDSLMGEIVERVKSNSEDLNVRDNYVINLRDTLDEDFGSFKLYAQRFYTFASYTQSGYSQAKETVNNVLVLELYRRASDLIVIALSSRPIAWMDDMYVEIQTRFPEIVPEQKRKFHTIGMNNGQFSLQEMDLKDDVEYDERLIDSNYNDSFGETWEILVNAIDDNKGGLAMLHGVAGSGKTNILKQLIARGGQRKIVYIPSYLAASLSDPSFIGFVRKSLTGCVLLIEDGEDVLKDRTLTNGNAAVSNVLNISDGIMGDALNILIICTFNCELDLIDEALRRKGRCIAEYKFLELTKAKGEALIESMYGKGVHLPEGEALTLANIYKLQETQPKTKKVERKPIGFR
jgi:hypothetical protein